MISHCLQARLTSLLSVLVWNMLRPKFEPDVEMARNLRQYRALLPKIIARSQILKSVYSDFLRGLKPAEAYCYPNTSFLRSKPEVKALIEADKEVEITAKDFQPLVAQLPEFVSHHEAHRTGDLRRAGGDVNHGFTLAKCVYRCESSTVHFNEWVSGGGRDQILIGWGAVAYHMRVCTNSGPANGPSGGDDVLRRAVSGNNECAPCLHTQASAFACKLIEIAGLNPETTTVEQMDALDARFAYERDSLIPEWVSHHKVFTWRGMVSLLLRPL